MDPIVFFWTGIVLSILFVTLLLWGGRQTRLARMSVQSTLENQSLWTACAGTLDSEKEDIPDKYISVSLRHNRFLTKDGRPIDTEDYVGYVVKGNSMQFGKINTCDVVFTRKGFKPSDLDDLPKIIVLKILDAKPDSCCHKIRRAWRVCKDSEGDALYGYLDEIMSSEAYKKLKKDMSGIYTSDEEMRNIFTEKLDRYKDKYKIREREIVISTTYNVKEGRVEFSIHPLSSVVGIVEYAFDVRKCA